MAAVHTQLGGVFFRVMMHQEKKADTKEYADYPGRDDPNCDQVEDWAK
jgi:hypothetical protein